MKAISIRQPWANLIKDGLKTIETRTWKTSFRGDLLVVSSRKPDIYPAGFGLCIVTLFDCQPMSDADWTLACCDPYPDAFGWHLKNIRPIVPIPIRGMLSIFEVDDSIRDIIRFANLDLTSRLFP